MKLTGFPFIVESILFWDNLFGMCSEGCPQYNDNYDAPIAFPMLLPDALFGMSLEAI
jgi:hypothetical protein